MLDCNERAAAGLAAGHEYYQIGALEVSPDSGRLAFCEDFVGRRQYRLRFKDLCSGEILEDSIDNVESDLAWANDNATVFYVEKDPETLLGRHVKKHRLGHNADSDALVFTQTDTEFLHRRRQIQVGTLHFHPHGEHRCPREWRYADADDPALDFKVFLAHERDHEYQIEHLGGHFLIRTNWQATNFRIMRAAIDEPGDRTRWQDVVAHRGRYASFEDFDVFESFLALTVRSGGPAENQHPAAGPSAGAAEFFIASDEPAYTMAISHQSATRHRIVRYAYSSLTTPTTIYDYDVRTRRADAAEARSGAGRLRSRGLSDRVLVRRRRATASASRSRWSIARTSCATARRRCCNTPTAPTDCRWIRTSRPPA